MSVKCAALVLANSYPIGLAALKRYFDAADVDIFVHLDAKVNEVEFISQIHCNTRQIVFIENRRSIYWRGFTMVEAMIDLLSYAWSKDIYDRFIILSDNTLPLADVREFRGSLENQDEYVAIREATVDLARRYHGFYMLDSQATQIRWIPVADKEFSIDTLSRIERLRQLFERGKKPVEKIFHGSQWIALGKNSVGKILDSYTNDEWLRESFEFSEVPDESYFHTIIAKDGIPSWRPLTYVEWSGNPPPRVFSSPHELQAIRREGELFARKINFTEEEALAWINSLL